VPTTGTGQEREGRRREGYIYGCGLKKEKGRRTRSIREKKEPWNVRAFLVRGEHEGKPVKQGESSKTCFGEEKKGVREGK